MNLVFVIDLLVMDLQIEQFGLTGAGKEIEKRFYHTWRKNYKRKRNRRYRSLRIDMDFAGRVSAGVSRHKLLEKPMDL